MKSLETVKPMTAPPDFAIRAAVESGRRSPCADSKRGVAAFSGKRVIATGFNAQPSPFSCTGSAACRAACSKLCEHAEQVAIRSALLIEAKRSHLFNETLRGADLVHAKVVDGELVAGGGPSCWQCSRLVLAVRLDGVWLYQRTWAGWCADTDECAYCARAACRECTVAAAAGNPRDACDPSHDPHYGLPEGPPRWRYYAAEAFHRATLAACGIKAC